ncbi:hypothetical protein [Chryseobacterium sp. BIGb0232]|uniref:hypothetical protein n=1 Tax=Chryseobacterium sp. BIGb0232 TaxID=2940598 RepID=UPI000F46D308|nr:hypothetical protein [Chryseobacterium sp. BIGb0232]MCS4301017.1 hypothetical protein [Chryseobacterium sp. BIGb0232]ROS20118.1 hypothetical protein EDF65_0820 [Chryseobacterium nakagawai]
MSDEQEKDSYTANPRQIAYDKQSQKDHEVHVVKIYFAKKIPKMTWVPKEETYPVKSGGLVSDVKKKYEQKGRRNIQADKEDSVKLKAKESVKITWEEEVQETKDGQPVFNFEKLDKSVIKKKVWVVAECQGFSGKLSVEIHENKLTNPENVYDNPVKFLDGDTEKTTIEFPINGKLEYSTEITLRPKSDQDVKKLVEKFAKRADVNAFLYFKAEVKDTQDKIIFPDETHEFLNKDGERFEIAGTPCYCNRDITVDEMIDLIYHLRDEQNYKSKRDAFFNGGKEKITAIGITSGKISENRDKIKLFTDEMNAMFKKFSIKTCRRKIHFLGQMYLETISFTYTYESRDSVPANYKGGVPFQGRGMKQITHDYNYLAYYDYVNGTKHYDTYIKFRSGYEGVGECVTNRPKAREKGLDEAFYEDLKTYAKNISENLFHAFNSAGWFSTIHKTDTITAMDNGLADSDVEKVTQAINGGQTNIAERKNYTKWTKEFFKYDTECVNK